MSRRFVDRNHMRGRTAPQKMSDFQQLLEQHVELVVSRICTSVKLERKRSCSAYGAKKYFCEDNSFFSMRRFVSFSQTSTF